ncbi:MAG: hypothetical protein AB1646_19740 [Thermodesulfobacteriota bacterium]
MTEPVIRMEDGRRVVTMSLHLDCERRPAGTSATRQPAVQTNQQHSEPVDDPNTAGTAKSSQSAGGTERFRWRLISAIQAWPYTYYGPQLVDYGYDGGRVLRDAVDHINRFTPPVMRNHTNDMREQVGIVDGAVWEESSDIPAGVSGWLMVAEDFDPKALVGLQRGFITAGSIEISMDVAQSHPDMDLGAFIEMQGRTIDGELVRWLPMAFRRVNHFALVHAGADPNARPRAEAAHQRADHSAGSHTIQEGESMPDVMSVLQAVCRTLGIEVVLSAGAPVPDTLEARATGQINALTQASGQFNSLAADLQALSRFVIAQGEPNLTSAEILNRLPARLELAAHGEAYLDALQNDALKYYGLARFQAEKRDPTDLENRQMARIRQSASVEELRDWIEEYRPQAESKMGPAGSMRTSVDEDLPTGSGTTATHTAADLDIRAAAARLHQTGGGNK